MKVLSLKWVMNPVLLGYFAGFTICDVYPYLRMFICVFLFNLINIQIDIVAFRLYNSTTGGSKQYEGGIMGTSAISVKKKKKVQKMG